MTKPFIKVVIKGAKSTYLGHVAINNQVTGNNAMWEYLPNRNNAPQGG